MSLAALVLASAIAAPAPPPSPHEATREISVLTYNVRGLPWPVAQGRAQALRDIGRELANLRAQGRQPDVVLLQEGFRGEVGELIRASGYAHWASGPGRRAKTPTRFRLPNLKGLLRGEGWGKATGAGLHVLSDLPIRDVRTAAYSACAGFDCLANKGVMLVRLSLSGGGELDVVNTHLNSKRASGASHASTLQAYRVQTDELLAFIATETAADRPLVVGGDFNVKNAPDRYGYRAEARPFRVVSEFCHAQADGCGAATAGPAPWLKSQDLQAFASANTVKITPVGTATPFDGQGSGPRLSDHDGYLVRYRVSWTPVPKTALAFALN
jgi:endonuclease/exonuclease/phosphatase family metal-dependent hydrolase